MPLQNRVTPFGDIVAMPQRGTFLGNRGIIHDPATRTLLPRRWSCKAWIICLCVYQDRRREVMARRSWTELFFLDEATALAAGHRPCFFCRRAAAERFRAAWSLGNGLAPPRAPEMDLLLHRERLQDRKKRLHPVICAPEELPTGTMLAAGDRAYLVAEGRLLLWKPDGYRPAAQGVAFDGVLTPPATMRALTAGYPPVLHASAIAATLGAATPDNRHDVVEGKRG